MMEENEITPYRMNQIMKTAADITNMMTQGKHLYSPTYRELIIILEVVRAAIEKSKEK
jgi:hypothetical protein